MLTMNYLRRLQQPICNQIFALTSRNYAVQPGNPNIKPYNKDGLRLPRWRKHWYLTMDYKKQLEVRERPQPRSARENWNYEAELSAFKLRLQIDVSDKDLRAVFTQPLPNRDDVVNYSEMSKKGRMFMTAFVKHYLNLSFEKLPDEGKQGILEFLCGEEQLEHIAFHLGYRDFIQCRPYPPKRGVLVKSFIATIEAIARGEGGQIAAGKFILDFIIPGLINKRIFSIWRPADSMQTLTAELEKQGKSAPEARLVRQSGVGTVTPVFFIALFSGKELLTEGAGESIELAEADAAQLVLKKMYGVAENDKLPMMGPAIDNLFLEKLFAPMMKQNEKLSSS